MISELTFSRRASDNITEELVGVLSSKASFEFKGLFNVIFLNLRQRNVASGGEQMLRLRTYEKLQSLVHQGAVTRTVTGATKKYKGVAKRMVAVSAEMKNCGPNGARGFRPKAAKALTRIWSERIKSSPEILSFA
jgi:hypothetical protein